MVLKYNDVLTTTLAGRTKDLHDNMSKNSALLWRLQQKGKMKPINGGSKILEELEYGEGDIVWYSGYDTISYSPKQLFTAAEYALKLCAVPVAISGEETLMNSGSEQMIDLLEKRINNAEKTISNKIAKAIYSDGTGSSGKEKSQSETFAYGLVLLLPCVRVLPTWRFFQFPDNQQAAGIILQNI